MKKNIFIIIFILFNNTLFSQYNYNFNRGETPSVSSPEVSKLFRYSDFPNISSIGGADIEIPIYTINLDGLEIPIKIKYDTKGIKVSDIASDIGLGWNLIYGGNIVKQIRDMNDYMAIYSSLNLSCGGFENEHNEKTYRIAKGYLYESFGDDVLDYQIDASPDLYLVNAPGLNDKFYIKDNSGKAVSLENSNNKIKDLSRVQTSVLDIRWATQPKLFAFEKVQITNQEGFEYNFNELNGSAMSFIPQSWDDHMGQYPAEVNTWKLSEIKSPYSNSKIVYEYENFSNLYSDPTLNSNLLVNSPLPDGDGGVFQAGGGPFIPVFSWAPNNKIIYNYNLNSTRIKRIIFKGGKINFIYSDRRLDYDGNLLYKIEVVDDNEKVIKSFTFEHSYFQPKEENCTDNYKCLRLRLDGILDTTTRKYTFYYGSKNSDKIFPNRSSSKTDFLGFYNNNSSDFQLFENPNDGYGGMYKIDNVYYYPSVLYPNLKDNYYPFPLYGQNISTVGVDRSSNENSLIGLLTKIIYPTGGELNLQYENDDCNIDGNTIKIGTARIKKMIQKFDDNKILEKNFNYKLNDGKSSGLISFLNYTKSKIGLEINNNAYVSYSKVEEEIVGNGKTIYEYSNVDEFPDRLDQIDFSQICQHDGNYSNVYQPCITPLEKTQLIETKFPYLTPQSQSFKRGLLKQKYVYDNDNNLLKKEMYHYFSNVKDSLMIYKGIGNYDPYIPGPCNEVGMGNKYGLMAVNYLKSENRLLNHIEKETHLNGHIMKDEEFFDYDLFTSLLKSKTKLFADGQSVKTEYKYPQDSINLYLKSKNIVNLPLQTTTYKINNGTSNVISKERKIFPTSEPEANQKTGGNCLPLSIENFDLLGISSSNIKFNKYDNQGNLLEYEVKPNIIDTGEITGFPVAIIWGYQQKFPIAKIEGATYEQVLPYITDITLKSNSDTSSETEGELILSLDTFRKNPYLTNYLITTYTYDPLIGVTSIIPPNGIRETYKYDTANRLQSVVDVNGKILKEFDYNYAPNKYYNTAKSQTFTRNNCGTNSIGSEYTYTIPDAKYTSFISQADADLKAQNDINTNGQNVANINGICTAFYCPLSFQFLGSGGVDITTNNMFKVSFGFSTGNNSINLPWTTGVYVAKINGICKPSKDYSSFNGIVYYTVKTTGEIILKTNGNIYPNNTSLNFILYFPRQ